MTICCKSCEQSAIGQVPGEAIAGQLVDENGNGLYGGWIMLDVNGVQISNVAYTDLQGNFHTTYPLQNAENIFIQFYSTNEYEPYVASFDELIANGKVTLKKKIPETSKGISTEATLALVGIGIGLISLQRRKTIGTNKATVLVERFHAQPMKNKLLIVGGVVAAGALIYHLFKHKPTPDQQKTLDDAQRCLDNLHYNYGIDPSLPVVQYSSFATTIKTAANDCGTDEDSIYRVFEAMNNDADICMLILKYGVMKYTGCFQFEAGSFFDTILDVVYRVLPQTITEELNETAVQKINSILSNKGIQYRF